MNTRVPDGRKGIFYWKMADLDLLLVYPEQ